MDLMGLVEEELAGPTVFRDLSKLDFDYVPPELPHRDEAMRFLARTFRGLTSGSTHENAVIVGPVGTGKTVVAKRFADEFAKALKQRGKYMEVVHVNCRRRKTTGLVLLRLLNHFDPHYPERGFSTGEMLRDLQKHMERRERHILVILDEVDALLRADGSNLIYDLTRFNSETGPDWIGVSLIMISQHEVLAKLDDASLSTFKASNQFAMDPYNADALTDIVQQRVDLAFNKGTVDPDSVYLVADIAGQEGNARKAIEILWKAGQNADDNGRTMVGPEDVRTGSANVHSFFTETKLKQLTKHPLLVLLALARRLERDGTAYATTGDVEGTYKVISEEHEETPRGHTQFWKYLKQLEDGGFLITRVSGKGHAGTTQLLSLPDIAAEALQEKVGALLDA